MRVCITAVLLIGLCIYLAGCGSSGGGSQVSSIRINSSSLSPFSVQVRPADSVQWINADTSRHQVVSGVLDPVPVGQRKTVRILIQPNNTFSPPSIDANLGDTVEWQNNRLTSFTLEIFDENSSLIATLNFAQGQIVPYNAFQSAGVYTFRQQNNSAFSGFVRLFGVPRPNNLFASQILNTGDTFTRVFASSGTFGFYVLDPSSPGSAFLDGTVSVQ